ncbi:hypothetical protein MCUN1_002625 [Malassezia cuniculi]|uniref:J domain-containing protein n=1 Tax=Malassezia cuniculi TaxID=948313 RepID=A0AAF0ERT4_9BASI|nr:hypothetical protein MCUN1_002625 [Malassezia cuniculi]
MEGIPFGPAGVRSARNNTNDEPLFGGTPFYDAHADAQNDGANSDSRSFYSLLNVEQDATDEQLRDAYKTLAVAFHPDKHPDPARKEMAEQAFRDIKRAYDVLSDPQTRAVYDHFGEAGLESQWAVAVRGQSPEEMRAEFERQARLRQAADAESLVKSRGEFAATVDATSLFAPPRRNRRPPSLEERLNKVNCVQLMGKHGFDMQVTNSSAVSVSGQMLSRGGMGGGNLLGTLKTHWSPRFFIETSATLFHPQVLTSKGQYVLDEHVFFTYAVVAQTLAAPPVATLTWGQHLSAKSSLTGLLSFKTGTYSLGRWGADIPPERQRPDFAALVIGVSKLQEDGTGWNTQCTLADVDQVLSLEWSTRVLGVLLRTGLNLSPGTGISAFTSGEQRVTENIRVTAGVECGLASGVIFKLKVVRLGQKLVLPIVLSPTFRADVVAFSTLVPAAAFGVSHYLYFAPKRRAARAARIEQMRRENAEALEHRRLMAEQTRELLRAQALKRAESEYGRPGVVIVQAIYGRPDTFPEPMHIDKEVLQNKTLLLQLLDRPFDEPLIPQSADQPLWTDVRVPLQMLVAQGQLVIPAGRAKSKLVGFYDPCIGEKKRLYVRYVFRGQLHEFTVDDRDAVAAPLRSQQL